MKCIATSAARNDYPANDSGIRSRANAYCDFSFLPRNSPQSKLLEQRGHLEIDSSALDLVIFEVIDDAQC